MLILSFSFQNIVCLLEVVLGCELVHKLKDDEEEKSEYSKNVFLQQVKPVVIEVRQAYTQHDSTHKSLQGDNSQCDFVSRVESEYL